MKQSTEYKTKGNTFFGQGEYKKAIDEYENALMTCPESVYKERAIYFGNIAACHLKQVQKPNQIYIYIYLKTKELGIE